MHAPKIAAVLATVLALAAAGCQRDSGPKPAGTAQDAGGQASADPIENRQLGMAIAALPAFFAVAANDGAAIELEPADAAASGRLTVVAGEPEIGGINLLAAVRSHEAEILERPGGEYKGQRELVSHLGTAFYSRGHYQGADGATEEETIVFLVHPWGDRTLQLIYRYPAGDDTPERIEDHLFGVLGELEPLAIPGEDELAEGEPAETG